MYIYKIEILFSFFIKNIQVPQNNITECHLELVDFAEQLVIE